MKLRKVFKENIVKNVFLLVLLTILLVPIKTYILDSTLHTEEGSIGSVLAALSIIAVLAGFGNFGFKYENVDLNNPFQRYFAHTLTGVLLFVIGISLIMTWKMIAMIMGDFILMDITFLLLYLACVGYDYWDLSSACKGGC
jgi:hypothetical protein